MTSGAIPSTSSTAASARTLGGWWTTMPRSSARDFVFGMRSSWPRPAGLSGWVMRARTWWLESRRASKEGRANPPEPMKSRRISGRLPVALADLLPDLPLDEVPLQHPEALEEQFPVEVVHLVAEGARQKPRS